jgi:hypothetical protein
VYPDSGINPAGPLPRPKPQIDNTTTLVYPQVPPTSDETSAMDHLLDLEWTVVDVALASAGSPDPSPTARRCDTTRARANPTQTLQRGRPRNFHHPGQRLRPGPSSSSPTSRRPPCRSTRSPRQPQTELRAHCAAAAGANAATTVVEPGHHRRQEASFSC